MIITSSKRLLHGSSIWKFSPSALKAPSIQSKCFGVLGFWGFGYEVLEFKLLPLVQPKPHKRNLQPNEEKTP